MSMAVYVLTELGATTVRSLIGVATETTEDREIELEL